MVLIVNLRHYPGDDLSVVKIPMPEAALGEFPAVWQTTQSLQKIVNKISRGYDSYIKKCAYLK
jgi:hypothetical protein